MNANLIDLNAMVSEMLNRAASKQEAAKTGPSSASAKQFFLSLRKAKSFAEEQSCIMQFCGYVYSEPHGSQLDKARQLAQRLLKNAVPDASVKEYSRCSAAPSISGYVAGLPDNQAKAKASLEAQLRQAIEEQGEALSKNDQGDMAKIERRINHIRSMLDSFGL